MILSTGCILQHHDHLSVLVIFSNFLKIVGFPHPPHFQTDNLFQVKTNILANLADGIWESFWTPDSGSSLDYNFGKYRNIFLLSWYALIWTSSNTTETHVTSKYQAVSHAAFISLTVLSNQPSLFPWPSPFFYGSYKWLHYFLLLLVHISYLASQIPFVTHYLFPRDRVGFFFVCFCVVFFF